MIGFLDNVRIGTFGDTSAPINTAYGDFAEGQRDDWDPYPGAERFGMSFAATFAPDEDNPGAIVDVKVSIP